MTNAPAQPEQGVEAVARIIDPEAFSPYIAISFRKERQRDALAKAEAIALLPREAPAAVAEAVPTGWKPVPIEPTDEMLAALWEAMFDDKWNGTQAPMAYATYRALIEASPAPAPEAPAGHAVLIDRDLIERAQHQLSASPFPLDCCVAAEITAALATQADDTKGQSR